MNVIISINPDPDGVRCGKCDGTNPLLDDPFESQKECLWSVYHGPNGYYVRGPLCLAAERKLRALVEALRDARTSLVTLSRAGQRGESLEAHFGDIRGFANSRAAAADQALAALEEK
jgi:hypothetical protein